jgi:hypothetical protein
MQAQQTEATVSPAFPGRRHWKVAAGVALVVLVAGVLALWFWTSARPLSQSEQQLVGKWTPPIGPNLPPVNAVRQIFWLKADRTLQVGHAPVITGVTTFDMTGTWRLDGDHLVLNARGSQMPGQALGRLFARAPNPPEMSLRMPILRREGNAMFVEDSEGSEVTFVRIPE